MKIQVLVTDCPTCEKFEKYLGEILNELNIGITPERITDIEKIASLGVMCLPALVVSGKVVLAGVLPAKEKIKELLVSSLPSNKTGEEQSACFDCFG